jgi:intracellular sulfur oxidation DsrE/DsrF family protein
MRKTALLTRLVSAFLFSGTGPARGAGPPDDREALKGLDTGKVIFDIRVSEPEKMIFNLGLIVETFEGLRKQGVKPVMIAAFRGPGVKLLTREGSTEEIRDLLSELKKLGVRMEVCGVATRVFKVDNANLLPEVILVGNGFASLIGYQNKGYAVIPIH